MVRLSMLGRRASLDAFVSQRRLDVGDEQRVRRGAHAHEDYTTRDDVNWRKHTLAWVDGNKVRLDYRPVHTQPLTSEQEGGISMKKIAPAERKF